MNARDKSAAAVMVIGTPWNDAGISVFPSSLVLIPEKITIASRNPTPAPKELTND